MEDALITSVMRELNSNMAASKPLLSELMDGDVRGFKTRDGSFVEIPREELEILWDVCDDSQRLRLRLPIYVTTDIEGDMSSWKVEGLAEADVVAKILGKKVYREGYLRLYHPDLKALKERIGDALMVVFTP